jgi:hypothetical protein
MSQLELSYRPVAQIPAGICFDAAARHILQALPGHCSTHLLGVLLLFSYTRNPKPETRNPKPETRKTCSCCPFRSSNACDGMRLGGSLVLRFGFWVFALLACCREGLLYKAETRG